MTASTSKVTPLYSQAKTIRYFSRILRTIDLKIHFAEGISPFVDLHSVVALSEDLVIVITSQTSSQAYFERKEIESINK